MLAATLLAATVFVPTASYAAGEGCVTEYFLGPGDDTEAEPIIVRNPDGSITIYPPDVRVPTISVLQVVANTRTRVEGFVDCVV